jgi:hypothetical protein
LRSTASRPTLARNAARSASARRWFDASPPRALADWATVAAPSCRPAPRRSTRRPQTSAARLLTVLARSDGAWVGHADAHNGRSGPALAAAPQRSGAVITPTPTAAKQIKARPRL